MKNIRLEIYVCYLQNLVGLPVFIGFHPARVSRREERRIINYSAPPHYASAVCAAEAEDNRDAIFGLGRLTHAETALYKIFQKTIPVDEEAWYET
jgi:hypothetical protein